MLYILGIYRSSHQRYSRKKGALTNLAKFTGKPLCQSLIEFLIDISYRILKYSRNYPYKVLNFLEILTIFLRSF